MEELKQKVYKTASDGKEGLLDTLLKNRTHKEIQQALNHHTKTKDELLTPLMIASKHVHTETVRLLLETYEVYADQTGTVVVEDQNMENATALWITGYTGSVEVAKLLLRHGANINHTTATLSTPIRVAAYDQHTALIELFIKEKANVNFGNKIGHTALMNIDGEKESAVRIARMLLQAGANPNHVTSKEGKCALHSYATHGSAELVEELFKWGAYPQIADNNNVTPIEEACNNQKDAIVKSLLSHKSFSNYQRLAYLELLASEYLFDDTDKCYEMLSRLMKERENKKIPKKVGPAVELYGNRTECKTSEELSKLKGNDQLVILEALMVRERVLGTSHWHLPFNIIYNGALFCDQDEHDKGLPFVVRGLDLKQHIKKDASHTLQLLTSIMAQMISGRKPVKTQTIIDTLRKCLNEFKRSLSSVKTALQTELTHTAIHLIDLFTKLEQTPAEKGIFINLIEIFFKLHEKTGSHSTPLHLACQEETYSSDSQIVEVCGFPNMEQLKLLLSCGGVNIQDKDGNTPLHLLVQHAKVTSDVPTLKAAVALFVDAKADVEIKNKEGENPLQVAGKNIDHAIKENKMTPTLRKMVQMVKQKC